MSSEDNENSGVQVNVLNVAFNRAGENNHIKRVYTFAGANPPEYLSDFLHNIHNNGRSLSRDTLTRLVDDIECEVFDKDIEKGQEGYNKHDALTRDEASKIPLETSLDTLIHKLKESGLSLSDDTIEKICVDFERSRPLFEEDLDANSTLDQ